MRIFSLLSLTIVSVSLGACNTVEGRGRDVERAGEKIKRL
jgi:predicted small secreted protein